MEDRRKVEALKRLQELKNQHQALEIKEETLKHDLEVLDADSLAANEKVEMLQARLKVATGELHHVEKCIRDTEEGTIPKGKLPGLPSMDSQAQKHNAMTDLMKKMMGNRDNRAKVDADGFRDDLIEVNHRNQKCTFAVTASYKFDDLVRDATRYWDLPESQCMIVSRNQHVDAKDEVWAGSALIKYELDRLRKIEGPKPVFTLIVKPEEDLALEEPEDEGDGDDDGEDERAKRRKKMREQIMNPTNKQVYKKLGIYVCFVVLWLILLFWRRNVLYANMMVSAARTAFVDEEFGDYLTVTYDDIASVDEFFDWLDGPVKESLFVTTDYTERDLPLADQNKVFYYGIPVGKLELKQYRVTNSSCKLNDDTQNLLVNMTDMYYIPVCYGFYNKRNRDISNFGPMASTNASDDGSGFTFHPKGKGEYSVFISGRFGSYPSTEAYIREIDFGNLEELETGLAYLRDNGWIDRGTRALIISLLLYEPNFDSYVAIQFLVEMLPSGLVYPRSKFRVVKMEIYTNWFSDIPFMVVELTVFTFIAYYFLEEFLELRRYWFAFRSLKPYFKNIFNLTDWVVMILQAVTVVIRVIFYFDATRRNFSPFNDLYDLDPNLQTQQATKLQTLAFAYDLAFQIDSLLICIMFFKFFSFFTVSPSLMLLWLTLVRATKDISILIFMAILLFMGFSTMANNLFGADMQEYSTILNAFSTLLQVLIGVFPYREMELVDRVWCRLFFVVYVVFMYFIIVNVFLAILNDSYLEERKKFMTKYGEDQLVTTTMNVKELARFAVLYAQDKNRQRKQTKYETRRAAIKAKQRKEDMDRKRKAAMDEKKKRREAKETAKRQRQMEEEKKRKEAEAGVFEDQPEQ